MTIKSSDVDLVLKDMTLGADEVRMVYAGQVSSPDVLGEIDIKAVIFADISRPGEPGEHSPGRAQEDVGLRGPGRAGPVVDRAGSIGILSSLRDRGVDVGDLSWAARGRNFC